ncbi:MAG: hypothetical protein FWC71_11765 [Defluviitaleaceae bacterium]|nr:hypothetical protein [Defluviitaleaceae bacterium]
MKKKLFIALCTLLLIIFPINADALSIVPFPIRMDLGDGLVFYMIPNPSWLETSFEGYPEVGGLYRGGELVYSFDSWLIWDRLYFSADAMSFLAVPADADGSIRFFEYGVYIRSHNIRRFLPYGDAFLPENDPFLRTLGWRIREKTIHDRANDRLHVTTFHGHEITFDLTNGVVFPRQRVFDPHAELPLEPNNRFTLVISATALAVIGVVIFIFFKRNQPTK